MSVWKRKDGIFQYDFRLERRRYNGTTGEREKRAAQAFEQNVKRQALADLKKLKKAEGADGPMTVEAAVARFWTEVGDHYNGNWRLTVWASLGWLTKELGGSTLIRDIGPNKIALLIAKRRGEHRIVRRKRPAKEGAPPPALVSNTTVNRSVTELLRTVLRRASRVWEQETQAHKIEWHKLVLKESQERVRELIGDEEPKLTASMRFDYLAAVKFAILYGLRKAELVGLTWAAFDWPRGFSVRGKGDKVRFIPLTPAGRAILQAERGRHPEAVFTYVAVKTDPNKGIAKGKRYPITYSGLSSTWRRFGPRAAGIADFRFHDTRHTSATRLLRKTGNLRLAQRLLGHGDIAATIRYAHATDDDLRRGLEAVEEPAATLSPAGEERAQRD